MITEMQKEIILTLNDYKNLKKYIKKYNHINITIGLKLDDIIYYGDKVIETNKYKITEKEYWFILVVTALNIKDKKEKYKYIYDKMCDILDLHVCSLCDFKCDKCISNRLKKSKHEIDGCCYFRGIGFCPYFVDKKCIKKSISCKLFMCSYIEEEYKFKSVPKTYPLLNLFFNSKQQSLLQRSYRQNFEEIIDKLISLS